LGRILPALYTFGISVGLACMGLLILCVLAIPSSGFWQYHIAHYPFPFVAILGILMIAVAVVTLCGAKFYASLGFEIIREKA
jgi:hypothetical protein